MRGFGSCPAGGDAITRLALATLFLCFASLAGGYPVTAYDSTFNSAPNSLPQVIRMFDWRKLDLEYVSSARISYEDFEDLDGSVLAISVTVPTPKDRTMESFAASRDKYKNDVRRLLASVCGILVELNAFDDYDRLVVALVKGRYGDELREFSVCSELKGVTSVELIADRLDPYLTTFDFHVGKTIKH